MVKQQDPIQQLIDFYGLLPHPEGGFYRQTYCSPIVVDGELLADNFSGKRHLSTAIYFLLGGTHFSAFHRIKSDELWHFYAGESLNIDVIYPNGDFERICLGSDYTNGASFQALVPAGCWFASSPVSTTGFSFVGCTVAPGFDFQDFELASRSELINQYPQHQAIITSLTRI
jgi:predicted cupin superfamily sugar epimerase